MRGVLFDKDGTLIDFDSTWIPLYREAALDLALGDEALAQGMLVRAGLDPVGGRCAPGSLLAVGTTDRLVAEWRPDLRGAALDETVRRVDLMFTEGATRSAVPITDLERLFSRLRGDGFRLGIATNDVTSSAEACFERLGLRAMLDFVAGYDAVKRPKPAPDMAIAFADACNIEPGDVVVVGDNIHDLEMGLAAGSGLTIGVLTGNSDREHFGGRADCVTESVEAVPGILAQRFSPHQ